ncbi:MAG: hypothetical protein VYC34_08685, partial [Planctomycetota bacterium]|nr:hypothetical protein [Planctomycetota bacterium]
MAASALALVAGGVLSVIAAPEARAINEARSFINWFSFQSLGIDGSSVAIASIEGGRPLPNHISLNGRVALSLAWPYGSGGTTVDNIVSRTWISRHATAVGSAAVGSGGNLTGIAPGARLYSGSIASGFTPDGLLANVDGASVAFPAFALTHEPTANAVADALEIPRWEPSSVINASFGIDVLASREGEDLFSRTMNVVAFMTKA